MGKVILFDMLTVDGFFEGGNKEINWHHVDNDFQKFALEQLNSADMLIFGRKTYELMKAYWPTEQGTEDDNDIADKMNNYTKLVFSQTIKSSDWKNVIFKDQLIPQEINDLKNSKEKNILIFGSSNLAASFSNLNLIDEYRFIINPVILGKGHSILEGIKDQLNLKLINSKVFSNGNVLVCYEKR